MNSQTILSIIKKEYKALLDSPTSIISLILFVFFWQFLFFRSALLVGEASLRMLFDILPWLLLFFSSAVTMSSFAQEKRDGTLELLLTHPVRETEIIIAKFFSSLLFILSGLAFAIPIAISFSLFSGFDWGTFVGQFVGSVCLAACFVSIGLFFSLLLSNQIAALLASSVLCFFFLMTGSEFITANLPLSWGVYLERLSVISHVSSISRGVIDVRDIWYFIAFPLVFLSMTYVQLLKGKYGNRKDLYVRYLTGTTLFIGIALLTTIIGDRIPGRIDLTQDASYTISQATQKTLGNLQDIVSITFYASSQLPSQLSPTVRQTKDILRDYETLGKGKITVITKDPSSNPNISQEATSRGVREVQFNVIGQEEFQVKTGFVGLTISYGDSHEIIPFIESTGDLEYQLTSLIAKLTNTEKKKIAFLSGYGEKTLDVDYTILQTELNKNYITETITIAPDAQEIATDASVLVVPGTSSNLPDNVIELIRTFLSKGKSALFLVDTYSITPALSNAEPLTNNISEFLKKYGVMVNQNIVYDTRSNETVRIGQGGVGYLLPYPFWIKTLPNSKSAIGGRLGQTMIPWGSTITLLEGVGSSAGLKSEKILTTSPYAGIQTGTIGISPQNASFSNSVVQEQVLAVSIEGITSNNDLSGRLVVVGDSDFLTDQIVQNAQQNLAFGISSLSWLSQDESLSGIQIRQIDPPKLIFRNAFDPFMVRYGNLAFAVVIPLIVTLFRLFRRRSLKRFTYTP